MFGFVAKKYNQWTMTEGNETLSVITDGNVEIKISSIIEGNVHDERQLGP